MARRTRWPAQARSGPWTAIRVAIVAVASALAVLGARPPPEEGAWSRYLQIGDTLAVVGAP